MSRIKPIVVYLSGPMTTGGNFPVNIRRGIEVAAQLVDRGYVVICPHEKAFGMEMLVPRGYEQWMEYDFKCIEASDVVLRMSDCFDNPLPSNGGDRECDYARTLDIPVYYSIDKLSAGMPSNRSIAPLKVTV